VNRSNILSLTLLISVSVQAHHSPNLHFDRDDIVEISGKLTQADWQNPHTQLSVTTSSGDGSETIWLIEGRSAHQFTRAGVTRDYFKIGSDIRVAGFRGRRNPTAMFATNILLVGGRELVTDNFVAPRWADDTAIMLTASKQATGAENAPAMANGIFRVWGPDRSDHGIDGTGRTLWLDSYPLTALARTTQANWDRIADNPYIICQTGMPAIMDLGTPMEFVQDGDDIVLNLEEQDSVRRINMTPTAANDEQTSSPLGRSVGRWDGATLEVTTTNIDWPWFDQGGIPQSKKLHLVERFTPSTDGLVLRYQVTVTDPEIFTEAIVLDRAWVWAPAEQIRPYNCTWERDDL
jgi:hypothetical protein